MKLLSAEVRATETKIAATFRLLLASGFLLSCIHSDKSSMSEPNRLIHAESPYLLQHAHNPVDWYPWGEEALLRAERENKLLLISIGYSACHWCHVMEQESFEDTAVARAMNRGFVCIKVDREERPDLDQVYMTAVQLMTGQGGWPLNVVALPDGRPVWGGTYFPRTRWMEALQTLEELWDKDPAKMQEYATLLQKGMTESEQLVTGREDHPWEPEDLEAGLVNWKRRLDQELGGPDRAPKFPMPNNLLFLHRAAQEFNDQLLKAHVENTLLALVRGGIYDQAGGGWARYSVDARWKVPHFEKMLYDNTQLISLLAEYTRFNPHPELLNALKQSLEFINRELLLPDGSAAAALDADSEGVEGLFYTWTREEFLSVIPEKQRTLAAEYWNVGSEGLWEEGRNILLRTSSDRAFAEMNGLTEDTLRKLTDQWKVLLLEQRSERVRPGLDSKSLTSWNALLVRAWCESYKTLGHEALRISALKLGRNLVERTAENGIVNHTGSREQPVPGFLEDQVWAVDAAIALAEVTGDPDWLEQAEQWTEASLKVFGSDDPLFYFSQEKWLVRQKETSDNVIPASNSQMARNLYVLGLVLGKTEWLDHAGNMLRYFRDDYVKYGEGYSNWALLALDELFPRVEVVVVGEGALEVAKMAWAEPKVKGWVFPCLKNKSLPLIQGRWKSGATWIYVCERGSCRLPVQQWTDALNLLP